MIWIEPVYDRTASDVSKSRISQSSLTELKGSYNATDLNRVNTDMRYIADELHKCGYAVKLHAASKAWFETDVPTPEEFEAYLNDCEMIRSKIAVYSDTPATPTATKFDYLKANDIEKILFDVEELIRKIQAIYFYCNDIYSGEV